MLGLVSKIIQVPSILFLFLFFAGIANFSLPLSSEPTLGTWNISVRNFRVSRVSSLPQIQLCAEETFKVEEIRLPQNGYL